MFFEEKKHSRISPSSAARWGKCTASISRSEAYPSEGSSIPARRGHVLHRIAELSLQEEKTAEEVFAEHQREILPYISAPSPRDLEYLNQYRGYVELWTKDCTQRFIEQPVDLSVILPGIFGTPDLFSVDAEEEICRIFDLKTGQIAVSAEENPQLLLYAAGIATTIFPEVQSFSFHIFQPWAMWQGDPFVISVEDLKEAIVPYKDAAEKISRGEVQEFASDETCRYCRAKSTCPAFLEVIETCVSQEPSTLSFEQKVRLLTMEKSVQVFFEKIHQECTEFAVNGGEVPGFTLSTKRKLRRWHEGAEAQLLGILGGDVAFEKKLLSPARLKNVLEPSTWTMLSYQPVGEPCLVPVKKA